MAGIKETKEVIVAVGILVDSLKKHLGDGFQKEDIQKISSDVLGSEEFKSAIAGVELVLPELKDLDISEKISLVLDLVKAAT